MQTCETFAVALRPFSVEDTRKEGQLSLEDMDGQSNSTFPVRRSVRF